MSIRFATKNDLPAIGAIYTPYVLNTAYSFEYEPPTLEEFTRRYQAYTAQFPWLVWEEDGKLLGYAYGSPHHTRAAYRWCAEVSCYLHPEHRGKGIGSRLYAALENILTRQGYRSIYAAVTSENTASVAFHQRLGYTQEAFFPECGYKFGRWHGIIWLKKQLNSVENPSNFPCSARYIMENDEKFTCILDNLTLS